VTLRIFANSQPARAPVALKWELIFPAQVMDMEGDAEMGNAVIDKDKSLKCTLRNPYTYVCTVSGGKNPIADGEIAIFRFRIRTTAPAVTTTLRLQKAVATSADGKDAALNNTESTVIIR
jgi:hypothetical protein